MCPIDDHRCGSLTGHSVLHRCAHRSPPGPNVPAWRLPRDQLQAKVPRSEAHTYPHLRYLYAAQGYTPPFAAITGIATSIVAGAILPRRGPSNQVLGSPGPGSKGRAQRQRRLPSIGFIMGGLPNGAGLKIANGILLLSGGNLFFTLVFTMVAS